MSEFRVQTDGSGWAGESFTQPRAANPIAAFPYGRRVAANHVRLSCNMGHRHRLGVIGGAPKRNIKDLSSQGVTTGPSLIEVRRLGRQQRRTAGSSWPSVTNRTPHVRKVSDL